MPATDAPASQQVAITACLNSSVWFRLRRLGFSISIVSTIVFSGHYLHGLSPEFTDDFAGGLHPISYDSRSSIWMMSLQYDME